MSVLRASRRRVALALSVAVLVTFVSQLLVGSRVFSDTSTKLSQAVVVDATGSAEEAERGVDTWQSGSLVKVILPGYEQTNPLRPAHTTPLQQDRRALLLTTRLRC